MKLPKIIAEAVKRQYPDGISVYPRAYTIRAIAEVLRAMGEDVAVTAEVLAWADAHGEMDGWTEETPK